MEPRSFVRIVAWLDDGRQSVGTGYRLSRNRVLTARHVVEGATEITVQLDGEDGSLETAGASVLWNDPGLDVAVLDCEPRSAAPTAFAQLARGPLARSARWQSRGCARAVPEGHCIGDSMAALAGTAHELEAHQRRLELTVEAPPMSVEDWSGISGAPVFVDAWIYGVVVSAPPEFKERLYATPMHRLLAEEGFAEAVGLAKTAKWAPLLTEIRRLLSADPTAARAIAEQKRPWRQAFAESIEGFATSLERSSLEEVLRATHNAHRSFVTEGSAAPARTVEQLLENIIPALYDRQLVDRLAGDPGGVMLRIPVATSTLAEIVMSAVDARPYRFRPLPDSTSFPDPVARVANIPEKGIDYDGLRAFQEFVDHLARQFVAEEDRHDARRRLEELQRYERLAQLVDGELTWQATDGGGLRFYFLFDSDFAEEHRPFLERLRRSLPALRLLELIGDDVPGERHLCRPLRDLLYRSQTTEGNPSEVPRPR